MDAILQGILNVIYYINDILVTRADDQTHLGNLAEVLQWLEQHRINLSKAKCSLMKPSVDYLGHRVDAEGLHTTADEVEAFLKARVPTNVQELRSFLGVLNYYGKFLPKLATILHPLHTFLKQDRKWRWTKAHDRAFQQAKEALTTSQVLVHYDTTCPMNMAADASSYGVGAVISHVLADGSEWPIAFASRTLTASEQNYSGVRS